MEKSKLRIAELKVLPNLKEIIERYQAGERPGTLALELNTHQMTLERLFRQLHVYRVDAGDAFDALGEMSVAGAPSSEIEAFNQEFTGNQGSSDGVPRRYELTALLDSITKDQEIFASLQEKAQRSGNDKLLREVTRDAVDTKLKILEAAMKHQAALDQNITRSTDFQIMQNVILECINKVLGPTPDLRLKLIQAIFDAEQAYLVGA